MEKKNLKLISILALFVTGLLLACGEVEEENEVIQDKPDEKTEEPTEAGFEPIPHTSTSSDFQMSDIDALVEVSLKMEGLRVQYAKMMSNGWQDELYSGPGKNTDGSKFYDYVADLLDNASQYEAALKRLEYDGILKKSTVTRGIGLDFANWCYSLNAPKEVAYERMLTILNKNHVTGNMSAMQRLFNAVPDKHKCGMTDARQWFINLYAGEYKNKCMSIHDTWLTLGEGEGAGSDPLAQYFDTYAELYDNGPGNPRWKDSHEVIKDVAEKSGSFYVSCIDEVTGGYVGKWIDFNDISEETVKLAKKIREGKATTSDLKKFAANLGSKYVKDKAGDLIGEDPGGLERLAGEITDFATTHAVNQADEEIAEGLGLNLYEIQKTSIQGIAVTIIEDTKEGNITIGFPGKDGNTHIATKPGDKNITVVTTDGERTTQHVSEQKPGKVVVESHPTDTKASIKVEEFVHMASKGGSTTIDIISNCPYYRFRYNDEKPDWLTVSRKGKTLTITVDPNPSEEERSASFQAEVSFEGKVADASRTVKVIQKGFIKASDHPTITASPTTLSFDGHASKQTVKLDVKTYQYYGGISDDDCEDWAYVTSNGSDVSLTVSVAANVTGKERTGTIYAFATNKDKVESMDDIELLPITIRQTPLEQLPEEDRYQFIGGYIDVDICAGVWDGTFSGGWAEMGYVNLHNSENYLTVTKNGKGLHFEYDKYSQDTSDTVRVTASFDIDDVSLLSSQKAKIKGLKYIRKRKGYPNGAWGPYAYITYQTEDIRFSTSSDIPMISWNTNDGISGHWRLDGKALLMAADKVLWERITYFVDSDPQIETHKEIMEKYDTGDDVDNDISIHIEFDDLNREFAFYSSRSLRKTLLQRIQQTTLIKAKE